MRVSDWMTEKPITVTEETLLLDAYRIFHEYEIRHLPVMRDDHLVGIVSDRDVGKFMLDKLSKPHTSVTETVGSAMTRNVVTIAADDSVVNAAMIMHNRKISCLPVLNRAGQLVGIMTINDLLEVLVSRLQGAP